MIYNLINYFLHLNTSRMGNSAFLKLRSPQQVHLQVAITATSTRMELTSDMWKVMNNKSSTIKTYNRENFPEPLDQKYMEQMNKVYISCIHPSQFLPQLFTLDNATLILRSGFYVAEQMGQLTSYSTLGKPSVAQHCRHIGIPGTF
jgi:hypothetical protein